jgi:hypothetical protein
LTKALEPTGVLGLILVGLGLANRVRLRALRSDSSCSACKWDSKLIRAKLFTASLRLASEARSVRPRITLDRVSGLRRRSYPGILSAGFTTLKVVVSLPTANSRGRKIVSRDADATSTASIPTGLSPLRGRRSVRGRRSAAQGCEEWPVRLGPTLGFRPQRFTTLKVVVSLPTPTQLQNKIWDWSLPLGSVYVDADVSNWPKWTKYRPDSRIACDNSEKAGVGRRKRPRKPAALATNFISIMRLGLRKTPASAHFKSLPQDSAWMFQSFFPLIGRGVPKKGQRLAVRLPQGRGKNAGLPKGSLFFYLLC